MYDKDHITYDEYGMLYSHCFACHAVIKKRTEIPSQRDPSKMVFGFMHLSNYRTFKVHLSNGSVMYQEYCDECAQKPIDEEKGLEVAKNGYDKALEKSGLSADEVNRVKARYKDLATVKTGKKVK